MRWFIDSTNVCCVLRIALAFALLVIKTNAEEHTNSTAPTVTVSFSSTVFGVTNAKAPSGLEQIEFDVRGRDEAGLTLLHRAAARGDKEMVVYLLEKNADVDAKGTIGGETPLYEAASNGHLEVVKVLVDKKADVNARSGNDCTPLYGAVTHGDREVVEYLLAHGGDISAKTSYGNTLLHSAVRAGQFSMVRLLVKQALPINSMNSDGCTAADLAIKERQRVIYYYLKFCGGRRAAELAP